MTPTKKTNPATKKPVPKAPKDHLSLEEKNKALEAMILQLQRKAAKEYSTIISLKQQVKALQEENIDLHAQIPSAEDKLKVIVQRIVEPKRD